MLGKKKRKPDKKKRFSLFTEEPENR